MEKNKFNYNYSFEARLHQTDDNSKEAFNEIRTLFEGYGLKLSPSWKKIRVSKGRELFAFIVFRGKKLAICFALDPKDLENTKYKGKDISDKKLYQKTPFEFKITSARKVSYLEDLVDMMLVERFDYNEKKVYNDKFRYLTEDTMVERGLIKKTAKKGATVDPEEIKEVEYVPFQDDLADSVEEDNEKEVKELKPVKKDNSLKFRSVKVNLRKSRKSFAVVNISDLNNNFNNGDFVDLEVLKLKGLVDVHKAYLKVLGNYGLNKRLRVKADKYSRYAKSVILLNQGEILD